MTFSPGTRVTMHGGEGTIVPISDWPTLAPIDWTDETIVIIRWDDTPGVRPVNEGFRFTPLPRVEADRLLTVIEPQGEPADISEDDGGVCGVIADDEIADNPVSCNGAVGPHTCTNLAPCDDRHHCNICGYDLHADDAPRTSSQASLASIRPSLVQLDQDEAAARVLTAAVEWDIELDDGTAPLATLTRLGDSLRDAIRAYRRAVAA